MLHVLPVCVYLNGWTADFEPAVNRYDVGGFFQPHQDEFSLTVNILLSDPNAFTGGGTAFYAQNNAHTKDDTPTIRIEPQQGTAVVFNGEVWHEGLPVKTGVRHLYVASFDLIRPTESMRD
jgi:predicted 2-oxoglutarate/Fe(II)-dependent dioxygenase YbiX